MRELLKPLNRLRRFFLQTINKNYTKNQFKKRKGKCKRCGKCCEGCKFLNKKTKLCKTYKKTPWFCHKDFPLDKTDQKIWDVEKVCGYKFEK